MSERTMDEASRLAASDRLLARLQEIGIPHETIEHTPLHTVAEAAKVRGSLDAAATKNLFVRDKKGRMWTITTLASREVDLLAIREQLGARGRLTFGSEQRLRDHLGLLPGSVSPLAAFHDEQGLVEITLDQELRTHSHILAHPLINTRTTRLLITDLERALIAFGHPPRWVSIESS